MKSGAAEGHRRRCASLGRRHDNRISTSESQSINRSCPRLPRIGQTSRQSDYVLHYPGQLMSVCDCFSYWNELARWRRRWECKEEMGLSQESILIVA